MTRELAVAPPVRRPIASSIEELIAGATGREPFFTTDSKSGSAFDRLLLDGRPHILKHVHIDHDWTMRFNDDTGCHPVQVWAAGLMDVLPERIDHAVVGVAGGLGRHGWGGAILMRDVTAELVPPGDAPLRPAQNLTYLDDLGALSALMLGWQDDVGLLDLATRWSWFGPKSLATEQARGWPDAVPRIAAEGWHRFDEIAPRDVGRLIRELRDDPQPLVLAARQTPQTFVHGDWKLGNMGTASDGRTILLDWTYPGAAPPCYELAWYLALNSARLPMTKEDCVSAFRAALERHGVDPTDWYDRQLRLCLLAALVVFGWEKALGDPAELGWWCDRAVEGAAGL